jgi:hypothetical protein
MYQGVIIDDLMYLVLQYNCGDPPKRQPSVDFKKEVCNNRQILPYFYLKKLRNDSYDEKKIYSRILKDFFRSGSDQAKKSRIHNTVAR